MVKDIGDGLSWYPPAAATPSLSSAAAEVAPSDGVDRISALPDDLLRDIVSRLPARDGARTTALASRWRGLWRSAPLFLRDADFLLASPDSDRDRDRARATIGRVLADHPGPFRKIQITCCASLSVSRKPVLVEWARLLAAKGVQDLILVDIDRDKSATIGQLWPLPDDILRCASLRRLFLGFWMFPDIASRGTDVAFPFLEELVMLITKMRDHDLDHMLACSPKLTTLALVSSRLPLRIHLRSPSLRCMYLFMSLAEEIAMVDAPRLERLILCKTCATETNFPMVDIPVVVKIDRASDQLRVLGYLDPRFHQLQIGNVVIKAETKAHPSSTVASVRILALMVNLGDRNDVKMMRSFLKCFPNTETLHVESSIFGETTDMDHAKLWKKAHRIECLKSHVKKLVIHEFRGEPSEFTFLSFIAMCAEKLESVVLVLTKEKSDSTDEVDEVRLQLGILFACPCLWAAEGVKAVLQLSGRDNAVRFATASDLSVNDPFME